MAKFKVAGNSEYKQDDNGGNLRNLSLYIDSIDPLGKEVQALDITSFADAAEKVIAGIETSQEWTISGHFDDTATTGPDAVLALLVGTLGSFEWYPVGTAAGRRKFSGECLCLAYKPRSEVKGRVEFEAHFKMDGASTVGTA